MRNTTRCTLIKILQIVDWDVLSAYRKPFLSRCYSYFETSEICTQCERKQIYWRRDWSSIYFYRVIAFFETCVRLLFFLSVCVCVCTVVWSQGFLTCQIICPDNFRRITRNTCYCIVMKYFILNCINEVFKWYKAYDVSPVRRAGIVI